MRPLSTQRLSFPALGRMLFWSVIAAAFIGPGTVTTAASAGAAHGLDLLWAVGLATLGCLLLQEAASRIPIATGLSLGAAIAHRYPTPQQAWLRYGLVGTILLGGVAYQSGNILGAVAGLSLLWPPGAAWFPVICGLGAALVLWPGRPATIARILGMIVAVMGLAFVALAWQLRPPVETVLEATFVPRLPAGSGWLVVGLLGTTIVPYNLFLGSGLTHTQSVAHMRQGLTLAILLGGLITGAILMVGTQVSGAFSFAALAEVLAQQLGGGSRPLFALGLFAAGFTSSVTAPLAAALTAQSLLGAEAPAWQPQGRNFRLVWGLTLIVGVAFAMSGAKPVPAILLAQALNGLLLPLVVLILIWMVNDPSLMSATYRNRWLGNLSLLIVLGFTSLIGLRQLVRAASSTFGFSLSENELVLPILLGLSVTLSLAVGLQINRQLR
ncbi:MAG: divalent metal cation transporter [Bacteroidetes bacterium]|nr:MAG: divalent metal cation transporter [Bacteroidota bacterium]